MGGRGSYSKFYNFNIPDKSVFFLEDQNGNEYFNRKFSYEVANEFVKTNYMNSKPVVLKADDFQKYMKDNGIRDSEVLARGIVDNTKEKLSAKQIADNFKYSNNNILGGKIGNSTFGFGHYFGQVGYGKTTGYEGEDGKGAVIFAVFSKKAKIIQSSDISKKFDTYVESHQKIFKKMNDRQREILGIKKYSDGYAATSNSNRTILAAMMGYNVISSQKDNTFNIIDRSALIVRE